MLKLFKKKKDKPTSLKKSSSKKNLTKELSNGEAEVAAYNGNTTLPTPIVSSNSNTSSPVQPRKQKQNDPSKVEIDYREYERLKILERKWMELGIQTNQTPASANQDGRVASSLTRVNSNGGGAGGGGMTLSMVRDMERLRVIEAEMNRGGGVNRLQKPPKTLGSTSTEKGALDPKALRLLENLNMDHTSARSAFYLARPVTPKEEIYGHILTYVENGQVHDYGLKVCNIIRVVRDGDVEFQHLPEMNDKLRLLLWHGTKKDYIAPILETGFRLPKPNGQMFGPGVYFADRASKSANYCLPISSKKRGNKAYLLLCDVLLGNVYNAKKPHTEFVEAPSGNTRSFDSVKCTGENIPDFKRNEKYKGSVIPCGPTVKNTRFEEYTVQFNEYIVYNTENIKIMFIVEVEFTEVEPEQYEDRSPVMV